jgi:DNA invertase Pin-like site-specific DNA recombinase
MHGEGETLSKHRKALFALAKKYLYTIQDVFEELVSGDRIIDRPQMQKLLHNVQDGTYDAVLCMDMDRLGRGNMIDQGLIQEAFKVSGTLIITPRKVYNLDDEHDEEWSEFEAFMARRELKIITRRMQRGRKMSAAEGKSITMKPPYGYTRDENFKLHPDPEEASIVRQIFEWQSEGLGVARISKALIEAGIPSPSGIRWYQTTVRHILLNEVYLGRIIWGKHKHTKKATGGYDRVKLPREQWQIAYDAHEPLVSEELWKRAYEMKDRMTPRVKQDNTLKNPFAGIMRCKECGYVMRLQTRTTRQRYVNQSTLKCVTYHCNSRQTVLRKVETRVLADIQTLVEAGLPQIEREHETKQNRLPMLARKVTHLEDELQRLEGQKAKLFDLLEQSVYTVDVFMERSRVLAEKTDSITEELKQARAELERERADQDNRNDLIPALAKFIEEYQDADDVVTKNDLLHRILDRIEYTRRKDWDTHRECELDYHFKV